ncbi:MAG: FAD-binding protein [Gammaproteobacteria bacterium]|nr:FAD-binding protein [Gammaproteobacteria bacterium]MCZ6716918.1 FAD-binding protein [Gammaproteobacteria bacterium]MCZ6826287.1 FAD-binding protein [Gammaproteobacteria bacterium]MCZ6911957.1 FAD-binding protein [Pseudomonadota bacterium]
MSRSSGTADLPEAFIDQLRIVSGQYHNRKILTDSADCWAYGYDNSRGRSLPAAVALPESTDEVAAIMAACAEHRIAVCPRGRGTSTTGGAIPPQGGLALSLERMNRILSVDPANRVAIVEAGVINQTLQDHLKPHGFFWPPDPTSAAFSTIGGNLACNAAGPRTLKYGTPRDNTLGLTAVTPQGRIIRTGSYTTKSVVGLDLTRLLIGSEGTLAIITEATLLLTPAAQAETTLRASYSSITEAAAAVSRIMAQACQPRAIEFMDSGAIRAIGQLDRNPLPEQTRALLLIDVDGTENGLQESVDAIMAAAQSDGLLEWLRASSENEAAILWQTRKALAPSLRKLAPGKINEDIVVPVSRMAELIDALDRLAQDHRLLIVSYGHAGNGNIHVNLLYDPADERQTAAANKCLAEVFELTLSLGGSLSGEHGIGFLKRNFVSMEVDDETMAVMRGIKSQLDPLNILNPGKMYPDQVTH